MLDSSINAFVVVSGDERKVFLKAMESKPVEYHLGFIEVDM